jgi:hypothetical protein
MECSHDALRAGPMQIETEEILSKRIEEVFHFIDEDESNAVRSIHVSVSVSLSCGQSQKNYPPIICSVPLYHALLNAAVRRWTFKRCVWG